MMPWRPAARQVSGPTRSEKFSFRSVALTGELTLTPYSLKILSSALPILSLHFCNRTVEEPAGELERFLAHAIGIGRPLIGQRVDRRV